MLPQMEAYEITMYRGVNVDAKVFNANTNERIEQFTVQVGWNLENGDWVELAPLRTVNDAQGEFSESIAVAFWEYPNPVGFAIQIQAEGFDPFILRVEDMSAIPETLEIKLQPKQ